MLTPILIAIAIIIIVLALIIAARPDEFRVSRATTIAAPPEKVFPHVNELRRWDAWSPWAKLDPNCQITYAGPSAGVGASHSWTGNKKVGAGRMTITESTSNDLIRLRLEFLRPFKATNTAEFTFKPAAGQTVVTWNMSGKNNFISKAFGLVVDCEQMVGKDFEKGLAALKTAAEAEGKN